MSWCLRCDRCGTARSIGSLHEIAEVANGWLLDRDQDRDLCPDCQGVPMGTPTVINCRVGVLYSDSPTVPRG